MSKTTITLLAGDGIGPEVANATVRVLDAAGAEIEWERQIAGAEALEKYGNPLPPEVLESVRRNRLALKGPVTTQVGKGFKSINVQLRQELELYANLRPSRSLESIPSRFSGVDIIVVRENTEDLYAGLEHIVVPGVVESIKIITEKASLRIARFAYEYARRHGRKRVTAVHKANIMKLSDGLFLDCVRRVATEYPEIAVGRPDRRQHVHAARDAPRGVGRAAAREPLRRHRLRPLRRARRRPRRGARRQHRHRGSGLRGGARQRSGHRRQGHRQPAGADALGRS